MPFVILGLLLDGPLSLYDLRKRFTAGISLFYSASFGALQRALQQLVEQGDVTAADDDSTSRRRKLYTVTPEGRARWRDWMLDDIPDAADTETVMLAKVYLLGRLDSDEDRGVAIDRVRDRAMLDEARLTDLATRLDAAAHDLPDEHRTTYAYQRATLDYGLRAHALMRAWADELREVRP